MSLEDVVADMREYTMVAREDQPAAICAHILDYANVTFAELKALNTSVQSDSHLAL